MSTNLHLLAKTGVSKSWIIKFDLYQTKTNDTYRIMYEDREKGIPNSKERITELYKKNFRYYSKGHFKKLDEFLEEFPDAYYEMW